MYKRKRSLRKNINGCGCNCSEPVIVLNMEEIGKVVGKPIDQSKYNDFHNDSWGMGATKSSYTSNQSPEPPHAIKLSSLINKPGVLSKKFRKACAKLGVELIVTNMHFETLDGVTGDVKRIPTLDTFNEIIDIIED